MYQKRLSKNIQGDTSSCLLAFLDIKTKFEADLMPLSVQDAHSVHEPGLGSLGC